MFCELRSGRSWKRLVCTLSALVLLLSSAGPALAWNNHGHRTVAAAAWERLSPQLKARTTELLKLNPYYPRWEAALPKTVTPAEHDQLIFIQAATWPDEIKDHKSGYVTDGRRPDPDVPNDYSDKKRHTYWHFRDVPFSNDGTPLPAIQTPNAETEIQRHRRTLASPTATDEQKSYALVWLLHLVGDIHQPLHCVTRVSKDDPRGDMGGNKVEIIGGDIEHATELHEFWDNILGTSSSLRAAVKTARALPKADARKAANMDVADWVQESFRLAIGTVYAGPIKDGRGPFRITEDYRTTARSVGKARAALAGERLATAIIQDLEPQSAVAPSGQPAGNDSHLLWYALGGLSLVLIVAGLIFWSRRNRQRQGK